MATWTDCPTCQGEEGFLLEGEWVECTACEGEGGFVGMEQKQEDSTKGASNGEK